MDSLIIKGAREHNLRNIDVTIPRGRLVVVTGLSGSGKSSLAFDTIYAEGQRRYVESLSAYARQFLEQMGKPDVDSIEGLSPAISIEQKASGHNPRSTVGTVTEVYDYLRLLYARIGRPHCWQCGRAIESQTVQQMVDRVLSLPAGTRFSVLAPVVRGRKGEYKKDLEHLRKDGYARVNVDGEVRDLSEEITLDKNRKHTIEVYVDRLVLKDDIRTRLTDSVETAVRLAQGIVKIAPVEGPDMLFSEKFACIECGTSYPEMTPRMFSFNNPYGACPRCSGLGSMIFFDPERIIPNPRLSLGEGAIRPWGVKSTYYMAMVQAVVRDNGGSMDAPFADLPEDTREAVLRGTGGEPVEVRIEHDRGRFRFKRPFEGVIGNLERRYRETQSPRIRAEFERYMSNRPCPDCKGRRLRKESLFVLVGGRSIHDFTTMTVRRALDFIDALSLDTREREIAARIVKEVRERLTFLKDVGLDYITLDRSSSTLSGGEGQRIRLATQIGSSLTGVLYILDEPSVGLHQRDNGRLLATLTRLRDLGNTVIVIEHDEETIRSADHVVDMGPGAGVHGGAIVCQGTPADIEECPHSLTGLYLSGRRVIPVPRHRRAPDGRTVEIRGATGNNLKDITVPIPVGLFTCITGVSGSGKSTLVIDTLYRRLMQRLFDSRDPAAPVREIGGLEHVDKVIDIDQSPIGRTPRSNPATYTGLFTPIRELFANLPESRMRGYGPGRYSFNVKGGRCEACEGDGLIRIEMHFLPDVFVTCEVCGGRRYNRETLEIRYKGKNIAETLEMSVAGAHEFFLPIPRIRDRLQTLRAVGLDYIKLGQSATTLSGGEAQRVKLSKELSRRASGRTLYILDEPTTGLHFADIHKLLSVLNSLVDAGNTVVMIEHNMEVIKTADWIIDLGPEGGDAGGEVVATGTPEQIAQHPASITGQYLRKHVHG
ncbi:MAG: excinuclease ABC subunit UvrA [Deltaproteobacteria bacterium]|nr:excinuclease ABC subunit UvrA [Deltaproteobacteria bacterium]